MLSWLVLIDRGFNLYIIVNLMYFTLSGFLKDKIMSFIRDDSLGGTPLPIPNREVKP